MKKILPIAIKDNPIVSACWTFAKTAIIKTSPYAEDWMASHLQLYMDHTFCTYFGESNSMYPPGYYDDILHTKNLDVFSINTDNIIPTIKGNLDEGRYILLRTNWNTADKREPRFHEVLIYGYDDEKQVFFVPLMEDRIFVPAEVSFEHIKTSHLLMIEEYKKIRIVV